MRTVAVTVNFDLTHDGHFAHIEKASKLGDRLVVIVDNAETLNCKHRYGEIIPVESRLSAARRVVKWLNPTNDAIVQIDKDGTVAETLRMLRPAVFAKGGDRVPDNMPQNEIDACKEIGCEIVYGVGSLIHSSSGLLEKAILEMENKAMGIK